MYVSVEGGWQTLEDEIGDPGKFNPGGFEGCNEQGLVGERYFVCFFDFFLKNINPGGFEGYNEQGLVGERYFEIFMYFSFSFSFFQYFLIAFNSGASKAAMLCAESCRRRLFCMYLLFF